MNEIKNSIDYSIFKKMLGNRKLDRAHLRKLTESIKKDNQLNLHPIIVNGNFEIIDGQHRLEAAKSLNIPIYYIQSETVSDIHLIDGNVNQKIFEVSNYIDYFALKEKNPVYIELNSMLKSTNLRPKALLNLILGTVSPSLLEFLKTGKFQLPSKENPKIILDFFIDFTSYTNDKRIKPISMFYNHNFTRALRWLFHTDNFDSGVFFKKLDLRWFDLKPQRSSEDWYMLLINIYNFKNHNKIEANENL